MYSEEHIIAYLRGDLADEELFAFEEALKTDTNLATSFAFMSDIQLAEDIWGETGVMQSLEEVWQDMPYAKEGNIETDINPKQTPSKQLFRNLPKKQLAIIGTTGIFIIATILYFILGKSIFTSSGTSISNNNQNEIKSDELYAQDNTNTKTGNIEEIQKKIEDFKQKEKEIEEIKQKIGIPKNESERRYLRDLEKQQEYYRKQRVAIYDEMIAVVSSEVVLPKVDTLVYGDVVFEWDKKYQNEDLELEIFTKETQAQPNKIKIKAGKINHKQKLPNNFYYWRLKVRNKKTIGLGRFYIANKQENIAENDNVNNKVEMPEVNYKRYLLNKNLENQIRTYTNSPVENFHIVFPRDGEVLETSVDRIEDKHVFVADFEWFGDINTGRYKVQIFKGANTKPLLQEEFPVGFFTKNKLTQFPVKVRLGLFTPDLYYLCLYHNNKLLYTGRFIVR